MDALSLSSEKLEPDGIYLLENGVDALVYIGKEAPSAVVQDLLGALLAKSPSGASPGLSLDAILHACPGQFVQSEHPRYLPLGCRLDLMPIC